MNLRKNFTLLGIILSCLLTYINSQSPPGIRNWIIEKSKYLVSVHFHGVYICVGSLVKEDTVLTAANCVFDLDKTFFTVAAGLTDLCDKGVHGQVKNVVDLHIPRDYDHLTKHMDIALIKCEAFILDQTVDVIPIRCSSGSFHTKRKLSVSGWGWSTAEYATSSNRLQRTTLQSLLFGDCESLYSSAGKPFTRSMICAAHVKSAVCVEETGAPGVLDGRVYAVASYNPDCSNVMYTNVFTDLSDVDVRAFLGQALQF